MNKTLEAAWKDAGSNLRGYIRTRVRDHFAAEDILQEVYLKAQQGMERLSHRENVQGWLFRIARNAIIDYYRNGKVSEPLDDSLVAEGSEPEWEDAEKLKASFRRMVLNLPERYREAVMLTEFEGLTQKELAERLGISVSGAKSRVQRGRQLLKRDLLECCEFEFDRRGKVIDYTPRGECCGEESGRGDS